MNKDQRYREKKRANGLVPVNDWVPREYVDQHKAHAEKLRKKAGRRKK